jgi:hypothetical protein
VNKYTCIYGVHGNKFPVQSNKMGLPWSEISHLVPAVASLHDDGEIRVNRAFGSLPPLRPQPSFVYSILLIEPSLLYVSKSDDIAWHSQTLVSVAAESLLIQL